MLYKREITPEHVIQSIVGENVLKETSIVSVDNDFDISNIDGVEATNIMNEVEENLGVGIKTKDFKHFKKVGDIVAYVTSHMSH